MQDDILFRTFIHEDDLIIIRDILTSTESFYDEEIEIAILVAEEYLEIGEVKSGYSFILAEKENIPIAYACYGKAPCTKDSYDLYWLAVHEEYQGQGIGKQLIKRVEEIVADLSGSHIWIETSSKDKYVPTRRFYQKMGYKVVAELPNFYGKNDNKIIYVKRV
jgi:ribosomal protein S18 acetylase RimI-like enzyme